MRIGIVCYPTLGGSGILATELGHELALRGHEVHFITYAIPFRLRLEEKNIFFHEVEINQYDLFKYPDYALTLAVKIAAVAKQCKLDILHVHYAVPHATSAFLAKQIINQKIPKVITTLHGTDITLVGKDPAYYEIVKFSIERSDGVTCVSEQLKNETCRHFHTCCQVDVIYNFFIPKKELFHRKPFKKVFVEEDEFLLLHASNFRNVKRPQDLIKIFVEMQKYVRVKLLLLGSGPGLELIRKMAQELNVFDKILIMGNSSDIDPYIASADLFLLPSEQESFGLVALEAMAYGIPVIASNAGGLPEVVKDGETGFLSPVGDVQKMAQDGVKLLTHPELYDKFSKAAKHRAETLFSAEKILPQYEEYYASILRRTIPI